MLCQIIQIDHFCNCLISSQEMPGSDQTSITHQENIKKTTNSEEFHIIQPAERWKFKNMLPNNHLHSDDRNNTADREQYVLLATIKPYLSCV